jgi:hypothetical protein
MGLAAEHMKRKLIIGILGLSVPAIVMGGCKSHPNQQSIVRSSNETRPTAAPSTVKSDPPSTATGPESVASLQQRILQDLPRLKTQGLDIVQWGPNATGTKEIIVVYRLTQENVLTLDHLYGADLIEVRNSPYPTAATGS